MTPKRQRYVQEYLTDFNATAAAIRAGYKPRNADVTSAHLMRVPEIRDAIAAACHGAAERNNVTVDEIVANFREIRDRCLRAKPVMCRRGQRWVQATTELTLTCEHCGESFDEVTCPHCQKSFQPETGVWSFDACGANTANMHLGRVIAAFTDKIADVSDEHRARVRGIVATQAQATREVMIREHGLERAEELLATIQERFEQLLSKQAEVAGKQ